MEQLLEPSPTPYTILLSTFDQGQETKFAMQIYSKDNAVTVAEAPPAPVVVKKAKVTA
jgi:hypothetical protein